MSAPSTVQDVKQSTAHPASPGGLVAWLLVIGGTAIAWACIILSMQHDRPRLLVSWHGFLHTAIATRFPGGAHPPENPFFAGQPLPYYWVYHWLGSVASRLLHVDPIHVFAAASLVSLVALLFTAGWIGRRVFRSTAAGWMVGWLAVAGLNPLGAGIAAAKHLVSGAP